MGPDGCRPVGVRRAGWKGREERPGRAAAARHEPERSRHVRCFPPGRAEHGTAAQRVPARFGGSMRAGRARSQDGEAEVQGGRADGEVRIFDDHRDNLTIDVQSDLVQERAAQMRSEHSEAAMLWNVFRALQKIDLGVWLPRFVGHGLPDLERGGGLGRLLSRDSLGLDFADMALQMTPIEKVAAATLLAAKLPIAGESK